MVCSGSTWAEADLFIFGGLSGGEEGLERGYEWPERVTPITENTFAKAQNNAGLEQSCSLKLVQKPEYPDAAFAASLLLRLGGIGDNFSACRLLE